MKTKILVSFFLFFQVVQSSLTIPNIFGEFPIRTTRYSNFLGDFSSECLIQTTAVTLSPEENICNLNSITTQVEGQILFTPALVTENCPEAKAYENAQQLNILAFIDVVPLPPGNFLNVFNIGFKPNQGDLPFLQVGVEVFGLCFYSIRTLRRIKLNPTTAPRRFLIKFETFFSFLTAIIFLFGFWLRTAYQWTGFLLLPGEIKDFLGLFPILANVHSTLLCAIYWNALRKGCFSPDSRYEKFWRDNFFRSKWIFASVLVMILLTIGVVFAIETFFEANEDLFTIILNILMAVDVLIALLFFFTLFIFIRKVRELYGTKLGLNTSALNRSNKVGPNCFKTLKGLITGSYIEKKVEAQNSQVSSNASLVRLVAHLSKWVFVYNLLIPVAHALVIGGFLSDQNLLKDQDDDTVCRSVFFFTSYLFVKFLMSLCKVKGLAGPAPQKKKTIPVEEKESTRFLTSTKQSSYFVEDEKVGSFAEMKVSQDQKNAFSGKTRSTGESVESLHLAYPKATKSTSRLSSNNLATVIEGQSLESSNQKFRTNKTKSKRRARSKKRKRKRKNSNNFQSL
eukprot:snap_masked-scaffold_2-processed-gene-7.54-mRNA-1 protein AED:1.00 eAED:1.00 QI:0/0/0/0/1/1/2/0/566